MVNMANYHSTLIPTYYISPIPDATIQQANWDASKVREKLHRDIEAHASAVRSAMLSEVLAEYEVIVNRTSYLLTLW